MTATISPKRLERQERQRERIVRHGKQLLAIFPDATEQDPYRLCASLRRIESAAHKFAEDCCNHLDLTDAEHTSRVNGFLARANTLLGNGSDEHKYGIGKTPIFVNGDPRGYALKIDDEYMRAHKIDLHRDWGGYGIVAPEIDGKE